VSVLSVIAPVSVYCVPPAAGRSMIHKGRPSFCA
jgi:hypothetical protein